MSIDGRPSVRRRPDFHMIVGMGGCLYKNTFPIFFSPNFEEKNILRMAEKYYVMISRTVGHHDIEMNNERNHSRRFLTRKKFCQM